MRGQKLLPTLFNGLMWRSRFSKNKKRRVNFFVQHLIQNADGTFNTYLPALVKLHDPNLIGHPVVSFVFNLLWAHLARYGFLRSRLAYLFLVVLVVVSQSILPRLAGDETPAQRIALFVCRVALYLFLGGGFSHLFKSILFGMIIPIDQHFLGLESTNPGLISFRICCTLFGSWCGTSERGLSFFCGEHCRSRLTWAVCHMLLSQWSQFACC